MNGYMKIQKTDKVKETLQDLKRRLNSLRLLVMEHVSTQGLVPKLSGFAKTSHRVGLVYASTIPVDSYVNGRGESDPTDHEYQTQATGEHLLKPLVKPLEKPQVWLKKPLLSSHFLPNFPTFGFV